MKKLTVLILIVFAFWEVAAGQIPKLPKIVPKPAPEPKKPNTRPPQTPGNQTNNDAKTDSPAVAQPPADSEVPLLLKTTLDIRCDTDNRYWKLPNESHYTSWIPQVTFKVRYTGATKLRLMAEYFTPDGKSWFTETLTPNMKDMVEKTVEVASDRVAQRFDGKATIATGNFGIKITDSRDGSVLFQGKFKVGKFKTGPNVPMFKNQYDFFVDQDWNLPIGYVWLNWKDANAPRPTVSFWLKGGVRIDDLEARLFYNGEEIATTDDKGAIRVAQQRYPSSLENKETHRWELFDFDWSKFRYAADSYGRRKARDSRFMNDMDGNYTIKVFHKGVQIREASFSVVGGVIADNGIAKNNGFAETKTIIPVKIMGGNDKWNSATWKADAFYGNPLTGFMWP